MSTASSADGLPQPTKRMAQYVALPSDDHVRYCEAIRLLLVDLGLGFSITSFERSIILSVSRGPGFVLHDDEVSLVERMNAHRTGAPVVLAIFEGMHAEEWQGSRRCDLRWNTQVVRRVVHAGPRPERRRLCLPLGEGRYSPPPRQFVEAEHAA
jgi:hypothetical protein